MDELRERDRRRQGWRCTAHLRSVESSSKNRGSKGRSPLHLYATCVPAHRTTRNHRTVIVQGSLHDEIIASHPPHVKHVLWGVWDVLKYYTVFLLSRQRATIFAECTVVVRYRNRMACLLRSLAVGVLDRWSWIWCRNIWTGYSVLPDAVGQLAKVV